MIVSFRWQYLHSESSRPCNLSPLNRSVLHYAVLSGSIPIVNLLLKQGAQVNFEAEYNKPTPLDLAILKGDVELVRLLLDNGEFLLVLLQGVVGYCVVLARGLV